MAKGKVLHGRTFHGSSSNYGLPNDEPEHQRLTGQQEALKLMIGQVYLAPLHTIGSDLKEILDICCGSGAWLLEMAKQFPSAKAVGIDISDPGIKKEDMLDNITFVEGDISKPLPFPDGSFDYVHMGIVPSFPERTKLLQEIGRVLRPNGYVEFLEPDDIGSPVLNGAKPPGIAAGDTVFTRLPHAPAQLERVEHEDAKGEEPNKTWSVSSLIAGMISSATNSDGIHLFSEVEHKIVRCPIGAWPKDERLKQVGDMLGRAHLGLLDGFKPQILENKLETEDSYQKLKESVANDLNNAELQLEVPFWYAWGKRIA